MGATTSVKRAESTIAGFRVDDEIMSLLRAHDAEEAANFKELIEEDGICDAIVLWNGIVVDGHRRLLRAEKMGLKKKDIPFRTKKFKGRADAIRWIRKNQIGRRNDNADQRAMEAVHFEEAITKAEAEDAANAATTSSNDGDSDSDSENTGNPPKGGGGSAQNQSDSDSENTGDSASTLTGSRPLTNRALAELAGVDPAAITRAKIVEKHGVPELVQAVLDRKIGLKAAAKLAKESHSRQREQLARAAAQGTTPSPTQPKPKDGEGNDVPSDLLEHFAARVAYDKALNLLTEIAKAINPLLGDPQANKKAVPGGEHLAPHRQRVLDAMRDLRTCITFARPYVPCPLTHKAAKCTLCGGAGFLTKELHSRSGVK